MISVIIPTYNEEKNVERCLKSLKNQTVPRNEFEVIVVDGQSKDRTVEIAKRYADKVIQQKSKGVGGARNDGVAVATGNIIATTDADCILFEDWIERIQKNFDNKKIVGLFGPVKPIDIAEKLKETLKDAPKNAIKLCFLKLRIKMEELKYGMVWVFENLRLKLGMKFGHYGIYGANFACDRQAFETIGGYRNLPVLDDFEIGMRLKSLGKIAFDNRMTVGYSVRRIEKKGIAKHISFFLGNHIRLLLRKKIKARYFKEVYT